MKKWQRHAVIPTGQKHVTAVFMDEDGEPRNVPVHDAGLAGQYLEHRAAKLKIEHAAMAEIEAASREFNGEAAALAEDYRVKSESLATKRDERITAAKKAQEKDEKELEKGRAKIDTAAFKAAEKILAESPE